jgi:hypothetical protein
MNLADTLQLIIAVSSTISCACIAAFLMLTVWALRP